MNYGTLSYSKESEQHEEYFTIKAEHEVELLFERLIPSHEGFPLRVRIHPENARIIRMVMSEFPLTIKTDRYQQALDQDKRERKLSETLLKLDYVEPNQGYFNGKLFPFQKQGLDFLIKTDGNTLIADEMGLGKTIEAISFMAQNPKAMPVVIISPLVTLINWKREIEKFLRLGNTRPDNQKLLDESEKRIPTMMLIRDGKQKRLDPVDIYIINYELVGKRYKDLCNIQPKLIVMDEIQSLRNETTKKYQAIKALTKHPSVEHRIGMSGTPIYNKGLEMYNVCEIIKSGVLGERPEFIRKYCEYWDTSRTDKKGKLALNNRLKKSIMIRRRKTEVLDDLPDKVRLKQTIPINTSLYEREIGKLYESIEDAKQGLSLSLPQEEQKQGLFELNKRIREMRMAERQIAGIAKVPYVIEYLNTLFDDYEEDKFVVFCHHITVHKTLLDGLWRYNPVQIIGGQSDKLRQEAIDKFQNDKETRVIICGLRAGNLGINLTSSAYVIFAELDWSPAIHRQAEDRLHRIGQKSKVFAHYLEGAGTFDEVLSDILLRKTVEISNVLGDKLDRLNNQQAMVHLENKFKFAQKSRLSELLQEHKK